MKRKFNVGDIIVGNDSSTRYAYTSKEMGFEGEVLENCSCGDIRVKILKCRDEYEIGNIYEVSESCFDRKRQVISINKKGRANLELDVLINNGTTKVVFNDKVGVARKKDEDSCDYRLGIILATMRALEVDEEVIQKTIDAWFNENPLKDFTIEELLDEIRERV
ncbi:hypothetical protein [Clostridium perfringens]|uniref:hypothetical protein n=1 Tax=Clostridium perfringens TaxID=1502 RepID=UPI0039ECA859